MIPRGAGTGLTGAAVAVDGGVMIDMSKMNKILGYDLENFVVRVEPGVLLNDLAEDAQKQGLLYPPDPVKSLRPRRKCFHERGRHARRQIWMHKRLCARHDRCPSDR